MGSLWMFRARNCWIMSTFRLDGCPEGSQSGPVRLGAMSVERSIWTRVVCSHKQQTEEMGVLGGSNIFLKKWKFYVNEREFSVYVLARILFEKLHVMQISPC